MRKIAYIFLFLFFCMLSIGTATEINNCTNITTSGTYTLTEDIFDSKVSGTCISILANNVTLDCLGNMVDGHIAAYGISVYRAVPEVTNVTIKNCPISRWTNAGIRLEGAYGNLVTNVTMSNHTDTEAIVIDMSANNYIDNSTFYGGNLHSFWIDTSENTTITNCNFSGDENAITITNSDNTNITLSSINDTLYEAIKILDVESENTLISDVNITNSLIGVDDGGNNTSASNVIIKNATDDGVYTHYGGTVSGYTITNSTIGIYVRDENVNVINNNIYSCGVGIIANAKNTLIKDNVIRNSGTYGIDLEYASENVTGNSVYDSGTAGIYLYMDNTPATVAYIYDNLFNNLVNVVFEDAIEYAYWNTTSQLGTRIYSSGTKIGGNYYTNASGTGYSDTCTDTDTDGFCDSALNISNMIACSGGDCSGNVDYLPLSDEYGAAPSLNTSAISFKVLGDVYNGDTRLLQANITDLNASIPISTGTASVTYSTPSGTTFITALAYNSTSAFWETSLLFDSAGIWLLNYTYLSGSIYTNATNNTQQSVMVVPSGGPGGGGSQPNATNQTLNKTIDIYIEGIDWKSIDAWLNDNTYNFPNSYILIAVLAVGSYAFRKRTFVSIVLIGMALYILMKYA
jgi:parallel beta-helix repeat protein